MKNSLATLLLVFIMLVTGVGPAAATGPAMAAAQAVEPVYLAIIWHQHQPLYYKDPATGTYAKPWVRVHATKDYLDMATTLAKYPSVKATFNITPSLIRQLDDLSGGAKDAYWLAAEKAADRLTAEDKAFIEKYFFDTNQKIIARFPRYQELANGRKNKDKWTEADWRDLQVLFNLAWTDPDWLARDPLKALVTKGKGFTEADKKVLFDETLRIIKQVIPEHKKMQDAGQIEVTMTPYAHPILPLLVNLQLAKNAVPDINLPSMPMIAGQDAQAQVKKGVEFYQEHFGRAPRGMWPAEGAVAQEIVGMVARSGIQWMASDEEVLAKSLDLGNFTRDANEVVNEADVLYRPYFASERGSSLAVIFRDKTISDKVGFTYSGMNGKAAAGDFVARIKAIRTALNAQKKAGPHLVSVILDGENAWEHYENDGKLFLETMYQLLASDKEIVTVTPSEYLAKLAKQEPVLKNLWAGSWVTPDYKTWIGEDEENLGWDYLARAREMVVKYQRGTLKASADKVAKATELLYAAEGSDWFWWYGTDQNSGNDEAFDEQFRATLGEIYDTLGEKRPVWLGVPIIAKQPEAPEVGASKLVTPKIDGQAAKGEWEGAGSFAFQGGAMASSKDVLDRLYYAFDGKSLYLRLDAKDDWAKLAQDKPAVVGFYLTKPGGGPANAFSRFGVGQTLLGFGAQTMAEVTVTGGKATTALRSADGENNWGESAKIEQAALAGKTIELALPFATFGLPDTGDQLKLRVVVSSGAGDKGTDQTTLPAANPALLVVPDLGLSKTVLLVSDPEKDDKGPGTYTYPTDGVFSGQAYDLKTFEVAHDDKNVLFKFTFYGPLNNGWGAPNGMGIHTVDIYIDQDGKAGSGERKLLPGRNAAVAAADAWDIAIWAEGWNNGIYKPGAKGPEKLAEPVISADPGQRKILVKVPKSLLGDKPEAWKYLAIVAGQEGFPSSGVWRIRDVQAQAAQWRFGGAPDDTNHTRIIDVALPESAGQFKLLSTYKASKEANMDKLGADDFAQLPMLMANAK